MQSPHQSNVTANMGVLCVNLEWLRQFTRRKTAAANTLRLSARGHTPVCVFSRFAKDRRSSAHTLDNRAEGQNHKYLIF